MDTVIINGTELVPYGDQYARVVRSADGVIARFLKESQTGPEPWCMTHDAPLHSHHSLAYGTRCEEG